MVQSMFSGICLWVGRRFIEFYYSCQSRGQPVAPRPPAVEAFLPISTQMSARYWLQPSSITMVVFVILVVLSMFVRHSCCRYLCLS